MSTITKQVTKNYGLIWKANTARINFDNNTVQISLSAYESQDDLDKDKKCHGEAITVPADGFDGSKAWCLTALKNDADSKLNGGTIA